MEILKLDQPHDQIIKMLAELRHDMVNHLQVIHGYARLSGNQKIMEYIDAISVEYQMYSRLSNMGHTILATNLIAIMMEYPQLQIDYYVNPRKLSLVKLTKLSEEELSKLFIDMIIALAAQETQMKKIHIVISAEKPDRGKACKILFSIHGESLCEQEQPIACLKRKISKYNLRLNQVYQDLEVFDWELVFQR